MSSTNKTTYYELPQFADDDIFNPLVDDNDAYDKIDTALHQIAEAEADDASEIVDVKGRVTTAEGKIEALETQNGVEALTTTAQTLSGAVNELDGDVSSLDGRLDVVEDDINNANTGLKVKVSALETQNGNNELTTTAQTLSGAVNELDAEIGGGELLTPQNDNLVDAINNNFLNSVFASQRYGSIKGTEEAPIGGQSCCYDNGKLYTAGGDTNGTFLISVLNYSTLEVVDYKVIEYDCHPNSISKIDDLLYIVDSRNDRVFIVNANSLIVVDVKTITGSGNLTAGCVYGDYFYVWGGSWSIYKCDSDLNLIDTIILQTPLYPSSYVRQTILIYDDYIYLVINQPNALIIFNMDGDYVATKEIGVGNGYFPYGEIECFYVKDNDVCFMSAIWTIVSNTAMGFEQFFISNINKPVLSDSKYGQSIASSRIIYCTGGATRASINPTGLSDTNPFTYAEEAGAVFSYLWQHGELANVLAISGTFADNDPLVLTNCKVQLSERGSCNAIIAFGSIITLTRVTVTSLYASNCLLDFDRGTIGTVTVYMSQLWIRGLTITEKIDFHNAHLMDCWGDFSAVTDENTIIVGGVCGDIYKIFSATTPDTNNSINFVPFPMKWVARYSSSFDIIFTVYIDTVSSDVRLHYTSPNANTINSDGSVTRKATFVTLINDTPCVVTINTSITKEKLIITSITATDLAGNAVAIASYSIINAKLVYRFS